MTLKERFDALMRNYDDMKNQNEFRRKQLAQSMKNQKRNLHGAPSSHSSESIHGEEEDSNRFASLSEGNVGVQGETEGLPPFSRLQGWDPKVWRPFRPRWVPRMALNCGEGHWVQGCAQIQESEACGSQAKEVCLLVVGKLDQKEQERQTED